MPAMTDEAGNRRGAHPAGSVLTAASALTRLGGGPDQALHEEEEPSSPEGAHLDDGSVICAPSVRSPSDLDDDDDDGPPSRRGRGGNSEEDVPMTFPQRLMELLDNERHSDVVAWLPHGKGFIIYQKKRFANEVLPRYFKQAKFTSFTRKLNRWGFQRVSRGAETGAYFHQYFQRGNPRLCMQMCCQSARGSGVAHAIGPRGAINPLSSAMTGVLLPPVPQSPQIGPMCMNNAMADLNIQSPINFMNQMQVNPFGNPAQISPSPIGMNGMPMGIGLGMGFGMGSGMASASQNTSAQVQPTQSSDSSSSFNPTQSLMRLQELQKQQEQLLMQQKKIKEQMAAVAKTLPQLASSPSPGLSLSHSDQPSPQQSQMQDLFSQQRQTHFLSMQSAKTPMQSPAVHPQQQGSLNVDNGGGNGKQSSSMYSQAVVSAAIDALQQTNTPAYLQMLMSAQGNNPKSDESNVSSSQAFQNQLHASVRAQHEQLQQYRAVQQKIAHSGRHQSGSMVAGSVNVGGGVGDGFVVQDTVSGQMHAMASLAASGGMSESQQGGSSGRNRSPGTKRASAA